MDFNKWGALSNIHAGQNIHIFTGVAPLEKTRESQDNFFHILSALK